MKPWSKGEKGFSVFEFKQMTTEPYGICLDYIGNDIAVVNSIK